LNILIIIGKVMAIVYMGIGFLWFWSKIIKLLSKPFRHWLEISREVRAEGEAFNDWVFHGDKNEKK